MRAVIVDSGEQIIESRRRLGIDRQDEMWEGEWHLVNPSKFWHPRLGSDLLMTLGPIARTSGLLANGDSTGIYRAADDWRIPDLVFARPEAVTEAGLTTAELVIELRSPGDESYAKLGFYAAVGVGEALIVHEDRRVELYALSDGELRPVAPGDDGAVRSAVLDVSFTPVPGPALRIQVGEATTDL